MSLNDLNKAPFAFLTRIFRPVAIGSILVGTSLSSYAVLAEGHRKNEVKSLSATISPTEKGQVSGFVTFSEGKDVVQIKGELKGLTPGEHGFHIHEFGDCSAKDGGSAGGHFNPTNKSHGSPSEATHHLGDLGNITADSNGVASISLQANKSVLSGDTSILGRSLVVHGGVDDLKSQPAGNSGDRIGCGVIGISKTLVLE